MWYGEITLQKRLNDTNNNYRSIQIFQQWAKLILYWILKSMKSTMRVSDCVVRVGIFWYTCIARYPISDKFSTYSYYLYKLTNFLALEKKFDNLLLYSDDSGKSFWKFKAWYGLITSKLQTRRCIQNSKPILQRTIEGLSTLIIRIKNDIRNVTSMMLM